MPWYITRRWVSGKRPHRHVEELRIWLDACGRSRLFRRGLGRSTWFCSVIGAGSRVARPKTNGPRLNTTSGHGGRKVHLGVVCCWSSVMTNSPTEPPVWAAGPCWGCGMSWHISWRCTGVHEAARISSGEVAVQRAHSVTHRVCLIIVYSSSALKGSARAHARSSIPVGCATSRGDTLSSPDGQVNVATGHGRLRIGVGHILWYELQVGIAKFRFCRRGELLDYTARR